MTQPHPSILERAWAVLTAPRAKEFSSFPLDVMCGTERCRVALDRAGARHLLVPAAGAVVSVESKAAILGLAVRRLSFGEATSVYVDIWCTESDLFPEFDDVVMDVLEAASTAPQPASAAIGVVGRWRRLFRSNLIRGLSRQAKLGLFAELTVLLSLVQEDPSLPVLAWRGPLGEPHDFELLAHCLEAKGLGPTSDRIVIHGPDQLNTHDGRRLDLVLLRVVEDPDGQSVTDLVDRLHGIVVSRADLRTRLSAAGWTHESNRPDLDTFAIDEVLRLTVDDRTPRIVPASFIGGSLPEGVQGLAYEIDLSGLLPLCNGASLAEVAREALR